MRKLLLAFITILPVASLAQKLEVGIHGGIGLNSIPSGVNHNFPSNLVTHQYAPTAKSSFVVSAKGLINVKRWQFGVGVDAQKISSKTELTEFIYANPAVPVYAIVNRKIRGVYVGIIGGILIPFNNVEENRDQGVPKQSGIQANTGYTMGVQIGYTHELTDNIGFNVETDMRFAATTYNTATATGKHNMNYFYYPVTAGFRFLL